MAMDPKYQNRSFLFIPFCYPDDELKADYLYDSDDAVSHINFRKLISRIADKDEEWEPVEEEVRYLLRFVSDKFNCRDKEKCQGYHFVLKPEAREKYAILPAGSYYHTCPKFSNDSKKQIFTDNPFRMENVHLFCFNTGVCIMAFELSMEESEPKRISSIQFYLKNPSWKLISRNEGGELTSFIAVAQNLVRGLDLPEELKLECFYYANKGFERANFFTYIEVEEKEDYREELFYLRHCYQDTYCYKEDPESERREIFGTTRDVTWGVSSEAAVCMACPDMGNESFIKGALRDNFRTLYLFEYVLLLHQKYFLYLLMTRIGDGAYIGNKEDTSLELLKRYDAQLNEFQTKFDYYCVSEVPQYQMPYERVSEAFALKKMEGDIKDPLIELRRQTEKEEERKAQLREELEREREKRARARENSLNMTITAIALLAFFSAAIDSINFFGTFLDMYPGEHARLVLQCISVIVIAAFFVYVICRLVLNSRVIKREAKEEEKMENFLSGASPAEPSEKSGEEDKSNQTFAYVYIGCFFSPEDLEKKISPLHLEHLEKPIENPHVTFCFHPESVDETLFGKKVRVRIVSYAKDETNEALGVELKLDNLRLIWLAEKCKISQPHITLSLSENGNAVDSGKLKYDRINYNKFSKSEETMEPNELEGVFGGFSKSGEVVTTNAR